MVRRIALFDYKIRPDNPIGGCHQRMLGDLCGKHEFTVFAVEFENPCPQRIRFVRIPAPPRPLALLFVVYHLLAPLYYWAYRLRFRVRFDLVQIVESNLVFGDVSYSQFCHRAYLKSHWQSNRAAGIRGTLRWLDHWLHAMVEPRVYRRVQRIVVPSQGLARELADEYPWVRDKIHILPNPVDIERMRAPASFDKESFRQSLGLSSEDVVLVFVALGHFERKGLPLLLGALQEPRVKLLVVGGERNLLSVYRARVRQMDLSQRVIFVGMQRDVRPYLWSADAFVLPSFYEIFPLVSLEAAAAGLPLIITALYGVEEFLQDDENGIQVEPTAEGIAWGISRFLHLSVEARRAMGAQARRAVERYSAENFVAAWRNFYAEQQMG